MISAQFFSTINSKIFLDTIKLLTYKLKYLRYWKEWDIFINNFKKYLNAESSEIILFYNARSALFWALRWIKKWDNTKNEIIVPSYTCVSVINAIKQAWFKPIYADIDKSLNITVETIKKQYSNNTIAIIVQHTFWNPAQINEITEFASNHNLIVIEDCAHSLWASIWQKKVWTFWDIAIFSTWRDKVISSVTWWILVINNDKIKIPHKLIMPKKFLVIQNLIYNIIAYLAYKTYDITLWKILMYIANKFKLIPKILTANEKSCNFSIFYYYLPNSLIYLANKQFKILDKINSHRIKLAKFYKEQLNNIFKFPDVEPFYNNIYFWVPIFIESKEIFDKIVLEWKKQWIYFWTYWSWQNIVPIWTNLASCWYKLWNCPNAEILSKQVLILPNHYQITEKQVKKVVKLLKSIKND